MKNLNVKQLSSAELLEINGGHSDGFWDAVFDFFGVPEEYRIV